jgi:hypothetical protein
MKQNKLLILSLLASFLLLISSSFSYAANTVTFGTVNSCPKPAGGEVLVPVLISNEVDLAALDIIGQIVAGPEGVNLVVTDITFDNRIGVPEILDQRYPIGDLGSGIFRLGAVKVTGADLLSGAGQIATLHMEFVSDCLLGSATVDPAEYDCGDGTDPKATLFVDPAGTLITPTVTAGAVNVVNAAPTITFCPQDYVIYWRGGQVTVQITATDPDLACGCDALSFTRTGVGSINGSTGVFQYVATGQDVGCHTVVVKVADEYGGEAFCEFDIWVLNNPPEITCPDEVINILWGQTATATVTAVDPDEGPSAMTYTLIPGAYPGNPQIDPINGDFTWVTQETNPYLGLWKFDVIVTDGAKLDNCNKLNADTCSFFVHVDPKFRVTIDKIHDVLQGHYTEVTINLDGSYTSMNMGGYDFLIGYDAPSLTFVSAEPGQLLVDCGWEYFTYRYGPEGNCGDACPSGMLRIIAMAETNNGPNHPDCFNSAAGTELAVLKFFVSNDRTFECMYAPIYFYWLDCGDNVIASKLGDSLFLEDGVFDFEGNEITARGGFPSTTGVPNDPCLRGDKEYPLRAIDFKNGGVDIVCSDSIDARGDINVNGVKNEIADAVMFTNYFISGLSVFGTHIEASIAASDVNADGITLSVADLVYMVRVIQGDALPYPKLVPGADNMAVRTQLRDNQMVVSYNASTEAGAALLRFELQGSIGTPTLGTGAMGMDLKYGVDGNMLNVLVYNIGPKAIASGDNVLLTIPVEGSLTLTQAEAADFNGNIMNVSTHVLPSTFALAQNYPNPFNPATTIELALPVTSDYSVAIYNIAGQLIRTYTGNANAGVVSIVWDGRDASGNQVASGMYFYSAKASQFSATKKMILMK